MRLLFVSTAFDLRLRQRPRERLDLRGLLALVPGERTGERVEQQVFAVLARGGRANT